MRLKLNEQSYIHHAKVQVVYIFTGDFDEVKNRNVEKLAGISVASRRYCQSTRMNCLATNSCTGE